MVPPLYKFRSINERTPEECYTLDSLRNSYVYFANATTLNDPFEMGAYLDQVADIEVARLKFMELDCSGSPIWPILQSMDAEGRRAYLVERWENDEWRELFIEALKSEDGFHDDLKMQMAIFCMSGTKTDGLLWAHYASGHRGIVIELDVNADDILSNSFPVTYQEEFPVIDVLRDDMETNFKKGVLTKAKSWKYEQEYRAVFPSPCEKVKHEIDPSVFVSITFGAKTSERTCDLVVAATRPRLSHVRFEIAKLGKKTFDVGFEEYRVEG